MAKSACLSTAIRGEVYLLHPLIGIRTKLGRSRNLLETFNEQAGLFLGRDPYEVVADFDSEKRTYAYTIKVREKPLPQIGILVGEILYQIRSSLDHLAWQLAILRHDPPPDRTEFPICDSAKSYKGSCGKIGGLPLAAQTIVDGLQPYVRKPAAPHDDPLWILHRLTNDDKHRVPHLVGGAPGGYEIERRGRDLFIGVTVGPFDEETPFAEARILDPAETDVEVEPRFTFELAFPAESAAKGRFITPELIVLGQEVEMVIREFRHFFP